MDDTLVELDDRRRVSLGRHARPGDHRFLLHVEPDGTIVLTPAVVISELEAAYRTNEDLVATVEANRDDPRRLIKRTRWGTDST